MYFYCLIQFLIKKKKTCLDKPNRFSPSSPPNSKRVKNHFFTHVRLESHHFYKDQPRGEFKGYFQKYSHTCN